MDETVPSASPQHHLKLSHNSKSKTAYLFILGGNTVVFIPLTNNEVLLMDSHLHGHTGAWVAHCESSTVSELLDWFRTFGAYQYTFGTVTKVTRHLIRQGDMEKNC